MNVNNKFGNLVSLGDYIEQTENRNYDLFYGANDVVGMTITKQIIPTKADVENTDLTKFLIVSPREFVYNPRTHGKKIGLGFNNTDKTVMISWNNIAFKVQEAKLDISVMPEYLYLLFSRDEWDREACYRSLGSSTEVFSWFEMCDMKIPLPTIEVQRELVDTYNGLKALAEQNEALIKPLTEACQAYIVDCKKKYPEVELRGYIEECRLKNSENIYGLNELQGVTSNSIFDNSKADTTGLLFDNYKIVYINEFAYNPSRINIGSIAMQTKSTCIVSPMYIVFKIVNKLLLPEYLQILFSRKEFQRSTLFYAMGSVRDTFDFNLMQEVKVSIPPPEVQQAIVNIYNCAEEAKNIANEAREKMKTLCPALVQRAINTTHKLQ
ncbi:MAG TPA: restriction endonuclease subunit S [Bacteroidales bacterium]|mgnify:CR=1 FL=1|nr:restriction endonuclease subunit S [Bacteroidales bacterium]HPT52395.1 restriction endonuclease subunit S [Bacteroidales bacterium]